MGAILLIAKKRMVSIAVNYLGYALQRKLLLTIIKIAVLYIKTSTAYKLKKQIRETDSLYPRSDEEGGIMFFTCVSVWLSKTRIFVAFFSATIHYRCVKTEHNIRFCMPYRERYLCNNRLQLPVK